MIKSAVISKDGKYRYTLLRDWSPLYEDPKMVTFIGLNPSTADAHKDDPTCRRCINFAKDWGFDAMIMVNLFAYRSTDPTLLSQVQDPVGPMNDSAIMSALQNSQLVIAAWGNRGGLRARHVEVKDILSQHLWQQDIKCFGMTNMGHPVHPLYQPSNAVLQPFNPLED